MAAFMLEGMQALNHIASTPSSRRICAVWAGCAPFSVLSCRFNTKLTLQFMGTQVAAVG